MIHQSEGHLRKALHIRRHGQARSSGQAGALARNYLLHEVGFISWGSFCMSRSAVAYDAPHIFFLASLGSVLFWVEGVGWVRWVRVFGFIMTASSHVAGFAAQPSFVLELTTYIVVGRSVGCDG